MTDKEDETDDGTSDLTNGEAVFGDHHGNHQSDEPSANLRPSGVQSGMSHINSLKSVIQNNFLSEFLVNQSTINHAPENVRFLLHGENQANAHPSHDRVMNEIVTPLENHDCGGQITGDFRNSDLGHHEGMECAEAESPQGPPDSSLPPGSVCSLVTGQDSGTENLHPLDQMQPLSNNHHDSASHSKGSFNSHSDSLNGHEIPLVCHKDFVTNHEDSLNAPGNSLAERQTSLAADQVDSVDHNEDSLNAHGKSFNHLEESLSDHEDSLHHQEKSLSNNDLLMDQEDSTNNLSDSLNSSDHSVVERGLDTPMFPDTTPSLSSPSVVNQFTSDAPEMLSAGESSAVYPKMSVYTCRWLDCTSHFLSLEELVYHINDQHVRLEKTDMEYQCKWQGCPRKGRGFNARYKMQIHIRTHTNEKPHECVVCGKCFSRLENLKIHHRSHTGEKPYMCPFKGCTKAYSNSSDRFKHVRTHQEEKPYICKTPGCNKRYTDPSSLRKHIRTHGHYFRGEPSLHSVSSHKSPQPANNSQSQTGVYAGLTTPVCVVPSTVGLASQTIPATPIISFHGNIMHISGLTSNPLLSSTIVNMPGGTPTTSSCTQTEGGPLVTSTVVPQSPTKETPLTLSTDASMLEEDPKCQESPLDLSTSPELPTHPVEENTNDSVHSSYSVCSKWELTVISAD